eukprot:NODE_233_length_1129_cov_157.776447_g228_i0.p1 GENE.NODE_233_length_1129_cov_157.776447_g228_i0~~NODE_233_length_1129_cov_157.776447_g228_i0.p1  ORF type:complete len:334 (-),score=89.51 NODE_233_length_1129_cov_157.776447_g228_i0:29-1030(-)
MSKPVIRVCVTGAAGLIGYSLVPMIAMGQMFGDDQPVAINLLDIEFAIKPLNGLVMELEDCFYPLLTDVVATTKPEEGFRDCDYCVMCGAFPRKEGMERKDLLAKNAGIFSAQGSAVKQYAKKDVKCLVVGNPANTNAMLLRHFGDLPHKNVAALTRLDMNRARNMIARRVGVPGTNVKNVIIWGNHSSTQFPDVAHATVTQKDGSTVPAPEAVNDADFLKGAFVKDVQQRGAAVIQTRGSSSATSAARAIVDCVRDWHLGTPEGQHVSMAVWSTGNPYNVASDLYYSFPVTISNGEWKIVEGLEISADARALMDKTQNELVDERTTALEVTK